jgi:hypothetical protein
VIQEEDPVKKDIKAVASADGKYLLLHCYCAHRTTSPPHSSFFFLKRGQKNCPNLLIKKKRIAQFINGKPGKNRYNKTKHTQSGKPVRKLA